MRTNKWQKPTSHLNNAGMSRIIEEYIMKHVYPFNCGENLYKYKVIIHAYKEEGTAVNVAMEWRQKHLMLEPLVGFKNIIIG